MPRAERRGAARLAAAAQRLSLAVNGSVEKAVAGLGLLMVTVAAAQVFARYVLNHSLFWSEELARYLLVWMTFLGASAAYRRGLHPGIDALTARLRSGHARRVRRTVGAACLIFFGLITFQGVEFAVFVRLQITPALQMPKWIVYLAVPVGGLLLVLHAAAALLTDFFHPEAEGARK